MAVNYKQLFYLLIEQDITNAQLLQRTGFSSNFITHMKRCNYISPDNIESIYRVMNCNVDDDILEFIHETKAED